MAKVTIEDISRQTGFSRGTVSRALNNRQDISAATRQRVLEACAKLNYVPSQAARSLATGRSFVVAAVVDDLLAPFAAAFVRGVLRQAESSGYVAHLMELGGDDVAAMQRLRALAAARSDGVLFGAELSDGAAQIVRSEFGARTLASVRGIDGASCDVVCPDWTEAGRLAARELFERGRKRVLYVRDGRPSAAADARATGFFEVAARHGCRPEDSAMLWPRGHELDERGRARVQEADGLACETDELAVGLYFVCGRLGRTPGSDVAVIGFGNERICAALRPSLSSVDLCGDEIGLRVMETVTQRLNGGRKDAPSAVQLTPRLIPRQSTRGARE
jgi:LacI family transcriptional regulator